MSPRLKRVALLFWSAAILAALAIFPLSARHASALGQLEPRSLTLEAGTDPGSKPGGNVKYLFSFTTATTASIGSIDFQLCTAPTGSCSGPAGLDIHSVTLSNQTGATGFTLHTPTVSNNEMYITRAASNINSSTALTYEFSGAVNPTAANLTFYGRITTYTSTDITTGATDSGVVAASTATQIVLTGYMPESLIFCTGGTITLNGGGVPDCSTASSGSISFPDFSPATTSTTTSQMAASTNALHGYAITVNGNTMQSGGNSITAIGGTATTANTGTRQFGLNLVANTTPSVGSDINPTSNGTNLKGEAAGAYATANNFAFQSGNTVADSANGGTAGPTDGQLYTVSYIVDVSGGQPTGSYSTTLTYICTSTF